MKWNQEGKLLRNLLMLGAFAAVLSFATLSQTKIANTSHDLSYLDGTNGEICVVCHTPHSADTTVLDAPLWNHDLTELTYTVYSSPTLDSDPGQPEGVSKLCLSCHDGSVAIDSFGGRTGTEIMFAGLQIGADGNLEGDHPVSFVYDAELAVTLDGELYDPVATNSGLGGSINDDMLFDGKVECSSCHDVHDAGFPYFLRKSNDGSALCLTCHDK